MPLMVQRQHKSAQFRPVMPNDPLWQSGHDRASVQRHPPFAPVADGMRTQHHVVNHKILVALEPRPCRNLGLHHLLLVNHPFRRLTLLVTASARRIRPARLSRLLHPARRLHLRPPLETLQPPNLLALCRNRPLQLSQTAQQLNHKRLQFPVR